MPDRADPQTAGAVDVLAALGVAEPRTRAAYEDDGRARMADDGVRMNDSALVRL
jgi:hypothetical protein